MKIVPMKDEILREANILSWMSIKNVFGSILHETYLLKFLHCWSYFLIQNLKE